MPNGKPTDDERDGHDIDREQGYPENIGSACSIAGCERYHAPGMVMCATCWHRVPENLQEEVYAAWKQRGDGLREGGEHYQMAVKRHEAAKKAAIEAVERRG